ncbi:MAG TPA: DNA polymerase IV [Nitrospiraceae bacterium]|nr:DNA polymerase IV [Nitrospiraceae bacterium]
MPRWSRRILFGDIDAMYASSAIAANPALAGQLVAVGSPPPRGIITAATYRVREYGIKAAMPTAHALRLCPGLVLVPPDRALYQRMHARLCEVTDRLFPETEWTSIDEFYADTTKLQMRDPDPHVLGRTVKDAIFWATGLRCTIAFATGKTIAKVAADSHKPDGLAIIEPGTEAAFLATRPARSLPGIGPKTAMALESRGIRTIADLLDPVFEPTLRRMWGPRLAVLQELAQGIDRDPVVAGREPKSLSHETTFDKDTTDPMFLEQTLRGFLSALTHELRLQGLAAGAFSVKLKDATFAITARQRRFPEPLNYDPPMWKSIQPVLCGLIAHRTRYRLVGLSLTDLVPTTDSLFEQRTTKAIAAMDAVIAKHGSNIIRLGGIPESQ